MEKAVEKKTGPGERYNQNQTLQRYVMKQDGE